MPLADAMICRPTGKGPCQSLQSCCSEVLTAQRKHSIMASAAACAKSACHSKSINVSLHRMCPVSTTFNDLRNTNEIEEISCGKQRQISVCAGLFMLTIHEQAS